MKVNSLAVVSWGIYSDQFANAPALKQAMRQLYADQLATGLDNNAATIAKAASTWETDLQGLDNVNQYAIRALHEAWQTVPSIAGEDEAPTTALVLLSNWGAIDSTIGFLDSMFDSAGRYTSPRHFTRSVYSSIASQAAIHFGIHGPCETLAHGVWPVCSVLDRAADLLANGRADQVMVCWADQQSLVAADLCRRAATDLGRKEYARFSGNNGGYGAVAMILKHQENQSDSTLRLELLTSGNQPAADGISISDLNIRPFPTDGAVQLTARLAATQLGWKDQPLIWAESGPRGLKRQVKMIPN